MNGKSGPSFVVPLFCVCFSLARFGFNMLLGLCFVVSCLFDQFDVPFVVIFCVSRFFCLLSIRWHCFTGAARNFFFRRPD